MRITYIRSGGFAGVQLRATVDEDALSPREAARFRSLVEGADWSRLPERLAAETKQPDRLQHELTFAAGGQSRTVRIDEAAVTPPLRALLEWLSGQARR